jgi:hypothetical protein
MVRRQIEFFATGDDLSSALLAVFNDFPFRLATFNAEAGECELWTPAEVRDVSVARDGSSAQARRYLVIRPDAAAVTRMVELRRGGQMTILDQQSQPDSVVLVPGGAFEGVVIAGQLGTVTDCEWGLEAYGKLAKALKANFARVQSYLVGNEAIGILDAGGRLTADIRAPREYDLRR